MREDRLGTFARPRDGVVRTLMLALFAVMFAGQSMASPAAAQVAGDRERIRIGEDWRFTRGDPAGLTTDLRYDVRPTIERSADGRVANAEPEDAVAMRSAGANVLKP